ncbi:MAG: hypothetical protein ACEQSK_09715 [Sphingomonadaceae bacterium]
MRKHSAKGLITLLFAIPVLASLLLAPAGTAENRNLAPSPALPHSWAETLAWPGKAELWINDHLGLRNQLIALNNRVRYTLFRQFPTRQLLAGQHGRLFLSAYNTVDAPYSGIQTVCGYAADANLRAMLVQHLGTFQQVMEQQHLAGRLLIAPSAPVLYHEDLPDWLQARCAVAATPIEQALATAGLQDASHVLYPLAALRAARADAAIFPSTWFHWAGDGPRLAADLSVQRFWPMATPAPAPLASVMQTLPSDLDSLAPGLALHSKVKKVDFAASGVQECNGASCFPEMPDLMAKLWGVNRYQNPAAPLPRLVLITDSFGVSAGPWFARYYRDVLQVATNDLAQLAPAEVQRLKSLLFQQQTPQHLLFLYHDGTVQGGGRIGTDLHL